MSSRYCFSNSSRVSPSRIVLHLIFQHENESEVQLLQSGEKQRVAANSISSLSLSLASLLQAEQFIFVSFVAIGRGW